MKTMSAILFIIHYKTIYYARYSNENAIIIHFIEFLCRNTWQTIYILFARLYYLSTQLSSIFLSHIMAFHSFSILRSSYNPTTVADANRWITLCKLIVGLHPVRINIIEKWHVPIIAIHWSMVGVAISIIHITSSIVGIVVMNCINFQMSSLTVINSDISRAQGIVVYGLWSFNMYVVFIRLFWHRSSERDRITLMLDIERLFSDVGIPVKLQRRRTYVRSALWAIGFVVFSLLYLSYALYVLIKANHPFAILVVAFTIFIMPSVYKQSAIFFYIYDLAETERSLIQLNEVLRGVLQEERRIADTSSLSYLP